MRSMPGFRLVVRVYAGVVGSGVSGRGSMLGWSVLGLAVGVYAGLVLSMLAACESRIFSLSLLATVRGGTSFLCPKRQRNEAKKTLLNRATLSVHSVQFLFIGAPKVRCSPERRMCETLLLANPDMNTLRPVRSRASTNCRGTRTASRVFAAAFLGALAKRALFFWWATRPNAYLRLHVWWVVVRPARFFSQLRPDASAWAVSWWVSDVVRHVQIRQEVVRG